MYLAAHFATGVTMLRRYLRRLCRRDRTHFSELARDVEAQIADSSYQDAATQTNNDSVLIDEQDQCMPVHGGYPDPSDSSEDVEYPTDQQDNEQALREQAWVTLGNVTEDDFTAGPARFVAASDGIQECPALLMTLNLAAEVQEAVEAGRRYAFEERMAVKKKAELMSLETEIECEISSHECRIVQESEKQDSTEDVEKLKQECQNLRSLLENVTYRKDCLDAHVLSEAKNLRQCQKSLVSILEEAFIDSEALDPPNEEPDAPVEDMNIQSEYLAFQKRQHGDGDMPVEDIEPLEITPDDYFHTNNDHLPPEELARYEVQKIFYDSRDHLINAQARFERREMDREMERQNTDEAAEDFDVRWVQRFRELTTELITAENAFIAAKAAALEAKIDIADEYQSSDFADRKDDGYRESHDSDRIAAVPRDKIDDWRHSVGHATSEDAASDVDVDDWDFSEADIGDSISCVDICSYRHKIDRWREAS